MTTKVWVFAICWNEVQMMPFFLRHYSTFADRIIIWDEESTDGTRQLVEACPKAELKNWPFKGLDDEAFLLAVNNWWKPYRARCDWVLWADADELLHHPAPLEALEKASGDIVPATGYALIANNGFPNSCAQIYDEIRTGARQENYDKRILWRSRTDITHTIGRHTYAGQWPKSNGRICSDLGFKLLHCHHAGGVSDTTSRNHRDYDRAVNKKYAWNYSPEHDKPEQPGSVAWVKDVIESGKLINVL